MFLIILQYTPLTAVTEAAEKEKPVPKVIKSLAELRQGGKDALALKVIKEVSELSGDVANRQAIVLALSNLVRSQSGQDTLTQGKILSLPFLKSAHIMAYPLSVIYN